MCVWNLVNKFKNDRLLGCTVSTGGGSLGGHWTVKVRRGDADDGRLTIEKRETHADRQVTTEYPVPAEVFTTLAEMANKYHMYAASKRRMSDMQILDGDTTTIRFYYTKGDFRVYQLQKLDRTMSTGFREIRDYMNLLPLDKTVEGVTTVEPQTATLHLRSGYTLQFNVEPVFDGRLNDILGEEHESARFEQSGIILCSGVTPNLTGASAVSGASACSIVYEADSKSIILLYEDRSFSGPVYLLAVCESDAKSAGPLIAEMEGPYALWLN